MKHILFLWLTLGCISFSYTQTLTITDKETQYPLEGVAIISESPREYATTNTEGQTNISVFKDVNSIQIRLFGYETQILSYSQIETARFIIALKPSNLSLNQIVISGTRWRQSANNIPSKIISITTKEVALQNPQTAADLLGASGKVFIQKSQQGGGSPMIRGFATNRLIYTVDGVRMNTAIFRGGNLQNVINIDPFATESTEVLFGPSSVIYGSDAIGGVMSFQTLTPQLSKTEYQLVSGKALVRFSSANKEKTGHFDVNVGWEKWAMVTSFSSWDFDHLKQGSHGPEDYIKKIHTQRQNDEDIVITQEDPLLQIPSAYSQVNLMQKVRFQPNENWDFQYGFHYSETSPYGRYDRHNRFKNGSLRYAEWNYGPQSWMMNNLSVSHKGNNSLYDDFRIRLAQQSFEESRIDRSLNNNERTTNTENVEAYSINVDFNKRLNSANILYYGLEYVLNDVSSKGVITDISTETQKHGPSRYPQATWNSIAVYLNNEYQVSNKLTLQGGLRYNRFILDADFSNNLEFYPFSFDSAKINNGALTGSIGAVYRPKKSWSIKTNIGTAFRSPNVDDIGKIFDSEPGSVTVPNPDLKAEYAYNFDLGIAKVFDDIIKLDLTGYYTSLQNAMVQRDYQLNGENTIIYDGEESQIQAIQNAAVAHVYGVQAGIEVKLPSNFMFFSDINYQKGEEELDDGSTSASRHAAPLFGVTRIRYQKKDLTLELNTMYQGSKRFDDLPISEQDKDEIYAKDANGNNYAPSWYTLNLKTMYKINETFSLSGGVENLTDQRYRPFGSGISGAGRNVIMALRVDF
ncbi:TonB-dependent receptor [Aestuariibaculum suncheonense]|uniref:TonB-dependent receptor n=1 Tax=Aestuariibaculum suncheonense TaxID=1028745 RepID=A0A8J6QDF7_9FLAO|nr:TonB-dependent receptor [Aestuariibaculum suncheonense]MBD0835055.1 TonB-dependent receptor [Aestuariibaculum suncheonense]